MVQVFPEQESAVALVRPGIQNVRVPVFVDDFRWTDYSVSVNHLESEKSAIKPFDFIQIPDRPVHLFGEFPSEHAEVEPRCLFERRRDLRVAVRDGLRHPGGKIANLALATPTLQGLKGAPAFSRASPRPRLAAPVRSPGQ